MNRNNDFKLSEIMATENICTFFQPIISLKTGTIFAYEALVRAWCGSPERIIYPEILFQRAYEEEISVEFDRLCRKKAFESYSGFQNDSASLIFININTSEVGKSLLENHPHISMITRQMGFDPKSIGLELLESKSLSSEDLINFVNHYRESGYLIVVDDFGCEHSNLDRLIQIHPDIIKIDRNIISGIERDQYRQSILKSIHSLAEMTGALCLAEGVETLDEIRTCHLLGVDLFQGFAIAYPAPDLVELESRTKNRMIEIKEVVKKASFEAIRQRRRLTGDINKLADWLIRQMSPEHPDTMNLVFQEFIAMNSEIECVYILDKNGIQISDTIISPKLLNQRRPTLFCPAKKGADHSFKLFFSCFEALKIERYLTDVYLSLASGNLCRTFSVMIRKGEDDMCILCMDFLEETVRTV